jgi:glycogen operon protein
MLVAGDEAGRTQSGNNNAYCQDNDISWINWENADRELIEFSSELINLRQKHNVFSRLQWFKYEPVNGTKVKDIEWFLPDGNIMTIGDWENENLSTLGVYLSGDGIQDRTLDGKEIKDDNFYLIFNGHHEEIEFSLPGKEWGTPWKLIMDTNRGGFLHGNHEFLNADETFTAGPRSVVVLINEKTG